MAVFDRAADGKLTAAGSVPTGGLGVGDGPIPRGSNPRALVLGKGNRFLYAVNGGSDTISVFSVAAKGKGLSTRPHTASGGTARSAWPYTATCSTPSTTTASPARPTPGTSAASASGITAN